MKLLTSILAALTIGVTSAAEADYLLKPPVPIPQVTTYSPVAGGFNGEPVYAYDMSGTQLYRTESTSIGMTASEAAKTTVVGDFITPPSGFSVDWSKTVTEFNQSKDVADGFAFYTALAETDERFVASRCGSFSINWIGTGGETNKVTYQVDAPTTVVPHRLYWTSAGFNGPAVSLPKNYGIRLFGRPALFWDESHTNSQGIAQYDNGVHYSSDNSTISAYAQSKETGPKGYFVVAYYDSGLCERLLGYTVVEVLQPEEVYLKSTVGSEVRPQNENYDPESGLYMPIIQSSQNSSSSGGSTNSREPYFLYQQAVSGKYHAKEKRVYAISETESGEAGAKKAEIYWEASDDFNVFWPFELSCYTITWPDCPIVVVGSNSKELGPGITVPTSYTAELMAWHWPVNEEVASIDSSNNKVSVKKAGRFCLKLTNTNQDNFWLLPFKSALNTDTNVFPVASTLAWTIGYEVLPHIIGATTPSDLSAKLINTVDLNQGGYIYETESQSFNWNPSLYHAEGASTSATTSDATFANLISSIYFVRTTTRTTDAEVWWMRSYLKEDMPSAVVLPVLPERYKATWPKDGSVQDIVIASTKGSGTGGRRSAGRSLFLPSEYSNGSMDLSFAAAASEDATIGFWFNPKPNADKTYVIDSTTGTVVSVSLGQRSLKLSVTDVRSTLSGTVRCQLDVADPSAGICKLTEFSAPTDHWMPVYVRFKDGVASVSFGGVFEPIAEQTGFKFTSLASCKIIVGDVDGGAATGTAIDELMVWNSALADDVLLAAATNSLRDITSRAAVRLNFTGATVTSQNEIYVQDENNYRAFTGYRMGLVAPGAPKWDDGYFAVQDDVTPVAYYQNQASLCGYNPNEEHAFALQSADGRYVLYALRNDMNDEEDPPYVFIEYADDGRGAMRVFRVLTHNEYYPWPTLTATAGTKIMTLPPLDRMPSGLCTNSTARKAEDFATRGPVTYRDRTGALWARRDGTFKHDLYYYGEDGFICTAGSDNDLAGSVLPFINLDNAYDWESGTSQGMSRSAFDKASLLALKPTPITQNSVWPQDPPTMSIAQVLTEAEYGLPEIYNWKTAAVVYPNAITASEQKRRVVKLIDPTVARTVEISLTSDFPSEYGFTLGSAGDCFLKQGKYYFTGLPPVVSDRLYVDINSASAGKANLTLIGDQTSTASGTSYLRVNSLSSNDCQSILYFFANKSATEKREGSLGEAGAQALAKAVKSLYDMGDIEPTRQLSCADDTVAVKYDARDHYALVATGEGTGYVTLIQNDGLEAEGQPISMQVINVGTNLYCGKILTLTDKNNTLSEQLNVLYTAPLGRSADNFYFQWFNVDAPSDGHTPTVPSIASDDPSTRYPGGDGAWRTYDTQRSGYGQSCIEAVNPAAATLNELVNRYWTLHYRARPGTAAYDATSGRWSVWCDPTLAEGWVQRVLNALTPFAQRTSDFYNNAADTSTAIPSQIGKPWQGDVALNTENLTSVGLMELYRTVLNKAESMSVAREQSQASDVSSAANKQLILAASRLADFNLLLGSEAYSDAKNPVIGSSSETTFTGSVFAFANQVDSLLDEEIALLRGRTSATSPLTSTYPCYNRLLWNYTKGMTQGEMAYVNNYDIIASDGVSTADTAAALYPQGHGDAYGYYLSAVTEFYRLLRNPAFTWGEASMMEMLVADKVVNVDYEEEDKFAEAAYRLAKTGADVVDLTARKQWCDNASDIRSGYFGDPAVSNKAGIAQALGYGETACRVGIGALCNWAVANSILPTSETEAVRYFTDTSIACVTRENCESLESLASTVAAVETKVNNVDSGLNPLGLSEDAIPFDISPARLVGTGYTGPVTHYEQIRERTVAALENCETALEYAQRYGSQLSQLREAESAATVSTEDEEREYNKQLIAIYGRPFAGDIGAGKLYAQGYDGPDLYHYMYMDLAEYGLSELVSGTYSLNYYTFQYKQADGSWSEIAPDNMNQVSIKSNLQATITFSLTSDGLIAKDSSLTGTRSSEGTIQSAYRDYLTAYIKAKSAKETLDAKLNAYQWQLNVAKTTLEKNSTYYKNAKSAYNQICNCNYAKIAMLSSSITLQQVNDNIEYGWTYQMASKGSTIVGMAVSLPDQNIMKTVVGAAAYGWHMANSIIKNGSDIGACIAEGRASIEAANASLAALELENYNNNKAVVESLIEATSATVEAAASCQEAFAALLNAQQVIKTRLEEGQQVLKARQLMRERAASDAVTARYQDMFARVERNNALSKYSTTFDIAQRYVFELAKVYDYETGLLTSDPEAGGAFLGAVVATRALGAKNLTSDSSVTDDGLWGVVTRLDANWTVLEGRLGANNPTYEEKWHSLRYSNFRIDPADSADAAWREELSKYWVDDIFADTRVARYCQPPAGNQGAAMAGLVIPFSTSISAGENFFGKTLMGGEKQYASSAYATRIQAAGVKLVGYENLVVTGSEGLSADPQVYLVPAGFDYMRTPAGTQRSVVKFNVVDQVLPLPYTIGSTELDDVDWVATLSGLDGTADSFATIRRHAQFPADGNLDASARLIGRSAWNDHWLLVIPANSLNGNAATAKAKFLSGAVTDIEIGLKTFTRQGN